MKEQFRLFSQVPEPSIHPRWGDVFTYVFANTIRYCAVASETICFGPLKASLIYFYKELCPSLDEVPPSGARNLLLPPLLVWQTAWSYKVFHATTAHISALDIMQYHAFRELDGFVVDERRHSLDAIPNCGLYVLNTLGNLEFFLGRELGLFSTGEEYQKLPVSFIYEHPKNSAEEELIIQVAHDQFNDRGLPDIEQIIISLLEDIDGSLYEVGTDQYNKYYYVACATKHLRRLRTLIEQALSRVGVAYSINSAHLPS